MQIIFHSDDMGFTPSISHDIATMWKEGSLDSFSIMANGQAIDEIPQLLQDSPQNTLRLVAHLNIFEGASLTKGNLICDTNGNLRASFIKMLWQTSRKGRKSKELLEQIRQEWDAQICKIKHLIQPRQIDALDSHLHFHMIPALFEIVCELCKKHQIPQVRLSREPFYLAPRLSRALRLSFMINVIKHILLRVLGWKNHRTQKAYGLDSIEYIVGVLYTGEMDEEAIERGLQAARRKKAASVEVLTHVGRATAQEMQLWPGEDRAKQFPQSPLRHAERDAIRAWIQKQR